MGFVLHIDLSIQATLIKCDFSNSQHVCEIFVKRFFVRFDVSVNPQNIEFVREDQ